MKLFISYSRDDKQWVYEFARRVSNMRARHDVWFDQDLHVSQKWWDEILNRIEWCEVTIVILTPRYVNSPFCMAELEYALALNKPIMPLRMKECEIPESLKPIQYFDIEALDMNEILIEIAGSLGDIRAELSNFQPPSLKPKRPDVPTPKEAISADPFELFAGVHQAAEQGDLARAEKLAQRLKQINPQGFGLEIDGYLNDIRIGKASVRAYLEIVALVEAGKQREARIAWKVYTRQYGRLNYDPKRYAATLAEIVVTQNPNSPPVPLKLDEPKVGTHMLDDKGVEMVYVSPGGFLMGSTKVEIDLALVQAINDKWTDATHDDFVREDPQHLVIISHPFWLDLTPVTNESYAQFVEEDGYKNRQFWTQAGWAWAELNRHKAPKDYDEKFKDPLQPRVGVTWFEAYAYCQWRRGRLPTEAEWEWAARGENNLTYPWGDHFDSDQVVWKANSGDKTARVGCKPTGASWVGALDMSGNVWEWLNSIYQPYPYKADDGRENVEPSSKIRVRRGGSWDTATISYLRAAFRFKNKPFFYSQFGGFRAVRNVN